MSNTVSIEDRMFDDEHLHPAMKKWKKWCEVKKYSRYHDLKHFVSFLGFEVHNPPLQDYFTLDTRRPEVRDLLMKINGPYGDVILKMIDLRNKGELDEHSF